MSVSSPALDVARIRADFPGLDQKVHGQPLVYLDNAATSQTPQVVIDAMAQYLGKDCANVHRGVHTLSMRATEGYEGARGKVQRFLGAADAAEIIFTRGATEAINLVAQAYGRPNLGPGDEVLVTHMEHHSNFVPWRMLCDQTGATLRVAPINDAGELILEEFYKLLGPQTKIAAFTWVSNALGTVNPVADLVRAVHEHGAVAVIDGAQAAPHVAIDVQDIDCDFLAVTGHKFYGPTGGGVLYGKRALLEAMQPYQGGGEMIKSVKLDKIVFNDLPHKFEAGTPDVAAAYGVGAAIDYLTGLGMANVAAHEHQLLEEATEKLATIDGLRFYGTAAEKAAVASFTLEGIHPHDVGTILDQEGVAVRTGHHCAQPVMERFGIPATIRASFGIYNTSADIDALVSGLQRVKEIFG